jgi:hypothetical protein
MAASGFKSLCGNDIHNILVEYDGQISSDSKIEDEFDTSDSGSRHFDDVALGKASESDIEGKDQKNCRFSVGKYGQLCWTKKFFNVSVL